MSELELDEMVKNLEKTYPRIQNLKQYLISIPSYHPEDPRYVPFWKDEMKKIVEGVWGEEIHDGKMYYRYCPGIIYFYGNYMTITDTDKKTKSRVVIKPHIRDLEWCRAYTYLEAQGFSGFELDEEYSSDIRIVTEPEVLIEYKKIEDGKDYDLIDEDERDKENILPSFHNNKLKTYIKPKEAIYKLYDKPMGKPVYANEAKNICEIGTRGGGKSYFYSGLILMILLIDGIKDYNDDIIIKRKDAKLKSLSCIGSADASKSAQFFSKITEALNQLSISNSLGAFNVDGANYPSPLYKQMKGDVKPGNDKNLFRHEYEVITNMGKQKKGTGSAISHVSYSTNKQGGGAEGAAGGRYNISLIEEGGLAINLLDIWGSNKAVVRTDGGQFGSQIVIGTSGNMDLSKGLRKIFENPRDYDCIAFDNFYTGKGDIGLFLPSYMVLTKYKDNDGNTDFRAAITHALNQRNALTTSEAIQKDKIYYPIFPEDMWITKTTSLFPVEEAKQHKAELLKNESLKKPKRKFVKLEWNKNMDLNVEFIPYNKAVKIDTFIDSQGSNERKNRGTNSTECDIIIYEEPDYEALKLYPDLYTLIGHDPYVSDDLEGGESLGATYIMKSPKYKSLGVEGDYVVAELTAKFENRDEYYKVLEKLLHYYGNPKRGLMYENNRGDKVAEYFKKVNKEQLLALTPILYQDGKAKLTQILKYGFNMANQFDKLEALNMVAEFLNEVYVDNTGVAKKNIFRIDSLGLLDEIINYDFVAEKEKKANYDRISAIIGCMIARREQYNQLNDKVNIPREDDNVKKLKDNPMLKRFKTIFKNG